MIYLQLFFEFFRTGLFAVGGGMATVPFLLKISQNTGWFSEQELANMIAVSESTPGPIGVNMSTYAGYSAAGLTGAFISTLSLVLPSLIIIILISAFLKKFHEKAIVRTLFIFLRATATGLLAFALYSVLKLSLFNNGKFSYIGLIFMICFTLLVFCFKKIHPIVWILFGVVVGIVFL